MADISKCSDSACPSKETCFRWTAKSNEFRQAYTTFGREDDAINCNSYWANGLNSEKCKKNNQILIGQGCTLNNCSFPNCVTS